jgi:uncharacterized membrane protein YuzA (DUF378 family)
MMSSVPYLKYIHIIVQLLIILGAINYLTMSFMDTDLIGKVSMQNMTANKGIKVAVGVSGLYAAYLLLPTLVNLVR